MAKIVSIFNNKGGVGKTTYMFHVAHLLVRRNVKVLMVDCDAQCNLTAYALDDQAIAESWQVGGNSIYRAIELVYRGIGDIADLEPTELTDNLWITPGDMSLSNFEDLLGDTWSSAKGGSEPALRAQSAIYRYIRKVSEQLHVDLVLVDLGPNLGALNRAILASSDYFIVPASPDLFSIKGTDNLGKKLVLWRKEWAQCRQSWTEESLRLPMGTPAFIGYVIQQHNFRQRSEHGMTRGWRIFSEQLAPAIKNNIVSRLEEFGQVKDLGGNEFLLGRIPNLHSLIPYSLAARKPVFACTGKDGLTGSHIKKASESDKHFLEIIDALMLITNNKNAP